MQLLCLVSYILRANFREPNDEKFSREILRNIPDTGNSSGVIIIFLNAVRTFCRLIKLAADP